MSITSIDRQRLRLMSKRCDRIELDLSLLYHRAVQVKAPLETLSAVACLARDTAAIHNRVYALRYPMEGAA
jgi:hypothetical protein